MKRPDSHLVNTPRETLEDLAGEKNGEIGCKEGEEDEGGHEEETV